MFTLRSALVAVGLVASCATAAADEMKFEVYKDKGGEYRWRLKATNGAVMATPGQGYKALADAKSNIETVKRSAIDDKMKYEVYEDAKKEHRWRLKSANGQVVASSSEGYKAKADADKAVETIKAGLAKATVSEVKDEK
ncbi:MAG TPA: DUF1508 domain-containing protein [Gemmataceae bacterium]|nr:DUF1508 domain-containing protein [Gemmataceae bacterium]